MEPITIKRNEQGGFDVFQGDRYSDGLAYEEMIGLVVSLTMPEDFSRAHWMKTEEQHRMTEPWKYRDKEEKPKETLLLTMK
ncbi:MAG: hypothetical protein K2J58_07125 [Muribaculaceae bacterium]|nr:hypothetical protein [Muribaculaceae bacterium]